MASLKSKVLGAGVRKVSQTDLRRLMSDHKKKLTQTPKKIESPLAKYSDDGTILCIVCNSVVKSDSLWNVHINAKKHKDNIARKKQPPPELIVDTPSPSMNISNDDLITNKRSLEDDEEMQEPVPPKKLKGILKNAPPLPEGFFDSEMSTSADDAPADTESTEIPKTEMGDEPLVSEITNVDQPMDVQPREIDLPEGFFDNPVLDAKARNVEYKDPVEEEWEKFQKEIKEENTVSAQIIQDDTDFSTVERQIIEVDEQLKNWSRVLDLEKKKEVVSSVKIKARDIKMEECSSSSENEENLDEFLDWRAKDSYK